MQPKKILLVIPDLGGGGAERVCAILLRYLNKERFKTLLVLFQNVRKYLIPSFIPVECFNKRGRFDFPRLVWQLVRVIQREKLDIILSFMPYANFISVLAKKLSGKNPRLFLSEQNTPSLSLQYVRLSPFKKLLTRYLYPYNTERIIPVAQGAKKDLEEKFYIPPHKMNVIHNPVEIEKIEELINEPITHPWLIKKDVPVLITVGRLTTQKGYPYLLKAFALTRKVMPCRLIILGEGELRKDIEVQIKELGVSQDITFLGFQQNPFKFIAHSDIFVLSSLWEGFGLVIIEAMVCRVPVVATRCPSGPDEIITDGVNGLLVPPADETALAEAILRLLRDDSLRKRLSQTGQQRARDFSVDKIILQYEQLFLKAIKGKV